MKRIIGAALDRFVAEHETDHGCWLWRGEPDPGAVLVTHLLLGLLGMLLGAIGGVSFTLWWLS